MLDNVEVIYTGPNFSQRNNCKRQKSYIKKQLSENTGESLEVDRFGREWTSERKKKCH